MSAVAAVRDVTRLCATCRIRARRASLTSLTGCSTRTITTSSRALTSLARTPSPYIALQRRSFSQAARSESEATTSSSKASPPRTHYDLFPETLPDGPPPAGHFPIDTRALRREFLRLQARAHPDMHPAESKVRAEATSALINEAYKTLLNPLHRAQYLLSLRGVDVANDETLKVEEPDLLMLVLEAREEIEEAEREEDLEEPQRVNDERIAVSEEALEQAFKHDDVDAAKHEAVRLRYWVNIKESLDNWERGKPIVLEH